MVEVSARRTGGVLLGVVLGAACHVIAFGGAWVAGRTRPSVGGFEDLAAVALTLLGVELAGLVAVVAGAIVLVLRGRREVAAGLGIGWLLGALAGLLILRG